MDTISVEEARAREAVQVPMGLSDIHFQSGPGPLGVWLYAAFRRLPRAKCSQCHQRRVLFTVEVNEVVRSPGRCGSCAGIR